MREALSASNAEPTAVLDAADWRASQLSVVVDIDSDDDGVGRLVKDENEGRLEKLFTSAASSGTRRRQALCIFAMVVLREEE